MNKKEDGVLVLTKIQNELKAPKNQRNSFGKYNYRSCEDILEALKPLLKKHKATVTISDEVVEVCGHMVVNSTVLFKSEGCPIPEVCTAQAGVDPNRKGMDIAQSFGSSSSYARKYALNGMFLIDDTKEIDSTPPPEAKPTPPVKPKFKPKFKAGHAKQCLDDKISPTSLDAIYDITPEQIEKYRQKFDARGFDCEESIVDTY